MLAAVLANRGNLPIFQNTAAVDFIPHFVLAMLKQTLNTGVDCRYIYWQLQQ